MTDIFAIESPNWMNHPGRNCAIPDEFTPKETGQIADQWMPSPINERRATKLCRGCPVSIQCAAYAIERPELEGVWGGTTTSERALMRQESVA